VDQFMQVEEAVAAIRKRVAQPIETGLILGSGLGAIADAVEDAVVIEYSDIPHFPLSTVAGHAGQLVFGTLKGRRVGVMRGRIHYYEGYSMQQVTFPVRLFRALGADTLVVTNSCGGTNPNYAAGDMMVIADHINLMGANPLIGPNDERFGVRFPPMAYPYDEQLRKLAHSVADRLGYPLQEGVYVGLTGPSFETPAEIRFFQTIGADVVGMSTVPETIVANHAGMRVFGLSCVTNVLHSGPSEDNHLDVLEMANQTGPKMLQVIVGVVAEMARV
jgi:purine-nucleoside phosphorylase